MSKYNSWQQNVKGQGNMGKNSPDTTPAPAPYNFISLNKKVVTQGKPSSFEKYNSKLNSGFIEVELKSLTPIFIRGNFNENSKNASFFGPDGIPRIPGSSLRGLFRNLIEIITFSRFGDYDNNRFYFRSFADRALNFRNLYKNYTPTKFVNKMTVDTVKCGLLEKKGARKFLLYDLGTPIRIKKDNHKDKNGRPITGSKGLIKDAGLEYSTFNYYKLNENGNQYFIIVSGDMINAKSTFKSKKHDHKIVIPKFLPQPIALDYDSVIRTYIKDNNRDKKANVLEWLNRQKQVPVFFRETKDKNGNTQYIIGHTAKMRMPYRNSISDLIKQDNNQGLDIAESIFGNETTFASRIFFEDLFVQKSSSLASNYHKILSSPKPTSFQLYLSQNQINNTTSKCYDSPDTSIRGNKLYWHREPDWEENNQSEIQNSSSQYTEKINPVSSNSYFKGRIRFENLSDVELGAVLYLLNLKPQYAMKLGYAKPLGLGSVRIDGQLFLSNRTIRYSNLESEWNTKVNPHDKTEVIINEFYKYVLSRLGEKISDNPESDFQRLPRIKELLVMLDFKNKPKNALTKYQILDEFKERRVLPKPEDVK